jgi:hypothetical protein
MSHTFLRWTSLYMRIDDLSPDSVGFYYLPHLSDTSWTNRSVAGWWVCWILAARDVDSRQLAVGLGERVIYPDCQVHSRHSTRCAASAHVERSRVIYHQGDKMAWEIYRSSLNGERPELDTSVDVDSLPADVARRALALARRGYFSRAVASLEVADAEPSRVTQECGRHDRVRESGEKTSAASGSFGHDVYASARDIS